MENLLAKYHCTFAQVMYATRNDRKTVLHLEDGRTIESFLPIKQLIQDAPADMFVSVNKGVVLAYQYIASAVDNVYTMTDGACFRGRTRQKTLVKSGTAESSELPCQDWNQYAILDDMPLAFCVIELVFDERGRGMDFIFRYCNKEMEVLEGKRIDEMLNRSFYEVFENGDRKWLVAYADVALNGVKRTIESYSPEINAYLKIYCYQPQPNYCACILMKVPSAK